MFPRISSHDQAWSPHQIQAELCVDPMCCTHSTCHGILFPFPLRTTLCHCTPNHVRCSVQARLCHKCCGHIIGLGPYHLSMTSSPYALAAVSGFSSFISALCLLIKAPFAICHCFPWTLLLICYWSPLVAYSSLVHAHFPVVYIPNAIAW